MKQKKLSRRYWLGELKRARLEKQKYIQGVMNANFSGIDPTDADANLSALDFCEKNYLHFISCFETWINDNYPAPAKQTGLPFGPQIQTGFDLVMLSM